MEEIQGNVILEINADNLFGPEVFFEDLMEMLAEAKRRMAKELLEFADAKDFNLSNQPDYLSYYEQYGRIMAQLAEQLPKV